MSNAKKPAKRKKAKSKSEDVSYVVEIKNWEPSYFLGINIAPKIIQGPLIESLTLKIKGVMLKPVKYAGKEIELSFVSDRAIIAKLDEDATPTIKPIGIGSMTLRGECREYFGILPFDTIPIINQMLEARQIHFVDLSGEIPVRGHASIKHVNFLKIYEPEEE